MIAIPAVDLREGACVQLVGGKYDDERVRLDDPLGVARQWWHSGFSRLHIVDLDAAMGKGDHAALIRDLIREWPGVVQVGGGVRDEARIAQLVEDGADHIVVGTRAIEEPAWLAEMAEAFPGVLIVAADVRERLVVTRGWEKTTGRDVVALMEELSQLPLAGALVTAVHKEGQLQGTDLRLMEDVVEAAGIPVIASGGVSNFRDLEDLEDIGVAGAVIGMALYTGALDPRATAEEFNA
jgi:phosphoribosylformimino-5-aminoimidazole carboxamide ribotide isomerase